MTNKAKYFFTFGLLAFLPAVVVLMNAYGHFMRSYGQAAPPSASQKIEKVSRPSDAFRRWRLDNEHGRVVVALTGRWQPVMIEGPDIDRVRYPLPLKNLALEREKKLDDDNFLFVASASGICRRLITILPEEGYMLRKKISLGSKTFRERDGTFTLYHEGFRRDFTTLNALRPPKEPVLLYIEESFSGNENLTEVLKRLTESGLSADSIVYALVASR